MLVVARQRDITAGREILLQRHVDVGRLIRAQRHVAAGRTEHRIERRVGVVFLDVRNVDRHVLRHRSEEHTSELQSLMRISYAVFCLKKKNKLHYLSYITTRDKTPSKCT